MIRVSEESGIWTSQESVFPENHVGLKMCEVCGVPPDRPQKAHFEDGWLVA
jgi:hypothetical protein